MPAKCINEFYKNEDIVFLELSEDFVSYVDRYFCVDKRLCQNTPHDWGLAQLIYRAYSFSGRATL